jgi:hypothetical protein
MYEEAVTMWNDERPIKELTMAGNGDRWWAVGSGGVTRIEIYRESRQDATVVPCGIRQSGDVIWFAIYQGDWLAYRTNGALIEHVWYREAPEAE